MKRSIAVLAAAILVLAVLPVTAVEVGTGIDVDIETEDFEPLIWMCDHRIMLDDNVERGRWVEKDQCPPWFDQEGGCEYLVERIENYAFEGEQIQWKVLVMDKNGIEKIEDVYVTVGSSQGVGNEIEANCKLLGWEPEEIPEICNARIQEEKLEEFNDETMAFYTCTLTVETPESMWGEFWVTAEVTDLDGLSSIMDENEFWFFNPEIALAIEGGLTFEEIRPGSQAYSETILVQNDAEESSGVLLDMFISGTDFYDSSSSGAKCPTTNQLLLDQFAYYATNGAYGSQLDPRGDNDGEDNNGEGYTRICYGDKFVPVFAGDTGDGNNGFYGNCEIIQGPTINDGYYAGNVLTPGAEIAMTFRLALPEPCNGDFDTGQIFFWGEAI